jgi:hypothetical protein
VKGHVGFFLRLNDEGRDSRRALAVHRGPSIQLAGACWPRCAEPSADPLAPTLTPF